MKATLRLALSDPTGGDWGHWRAVMFARLRLVGLAYMAVVLLGIAAVASAVIR